MGYYIDLVDANWEIKETPESLSTIREMPIKYHALKRGGSSSGEKWFSWMNDTEIENAVSVENVFNQLGFETEKTDGGFKLTGYSSKTGQEDLFLAVLAPWTVDGSHLEWRGEDGEVWMYEVHKGEMFRRDSELIFSEPTTYTYHEYVFDAETMRGVSLEVDIRDEKSLKEAIEIATAQDAKNEQHYAKLRAEREQIASTDA